MGNLASCFHFLVVGFPVCMVIEADVARVSLGFPEKLGLASFVFFGAPSFKGSKISWRETFVPSVSILESANISYLFNAKSISSI